MKNKQFSIKMSDYFQLNKPEYAYLKLTPSTSVKNNKASDVAGIINGVYIDIIERFKKHNKGFSYSTNSKVSFIIDITKDNASFYMIIPKLHLKEFNQKLTETFGKITIEEVNNIAAIKRSCTKYSLSYAKDDSLSLCVDKRDNDLLSANLSVMDILQDDDRVTIMYNFLPQSKLTLNSWKNYHADMMKQYNDGKCLDKTFTLNKVLLSIGSLIFNTIDIIINSIQWCFGGNDNNEDLMKRLVPVQELTNATKKKENAEIINTQIMLFSQSKDECREKDNAKTLINTFSTVGEKADNKLIAKKIIDKSKKEKKSIGIKKRHKANIVNEESINEIKDEVVDFNTYDYNCDINKMSCEEIGSNCISLAGKSLIEEHNLEAIQHNETIIPEELQGGKVIYGTNTFRGKTTTVTTSTDEDAACMPELIMAKMGGGKTSSFENKGVDAVTSGEGLISIDFIKNCEMSDNILRNIDKDKAVVIDFSDYMCKEGFGFNEINMIRDMSSAMSRYECAILQNAQITQFIDNLGEEEFSASMGRYLDAACTAVLIHEDKGIKDVVKCLECYETRGQYVEMLEMFALEMPEEYRELVYEDISALEELNEYKKVNKSKKKKDDKADSNADEMEVAGTNISKISGIISRISMLKKNPSLKFMYIRSPKNNINLAELMQQGKAIFFKLPQHKFSSPTVKNIMVSYLFSKIMIASEIRSTVYANEKLRIVHVLCDEIQQAKGSYTNVSEMAFQMRKFRVKLVLSTHNFKKIAPIKDILIDAGASIIMLRGSSVKDFEVMQDEFAKFGFTKDDLISLSHTDKYKALCLIATRKGRHGCIVEMPKPVKNKIELQNIIEVDFTKKDKIIEEVKEAN